jgi:hypothetical protein
MSKKIVAFHSYQLGERGTEIHMYNLAKYNQEILGNESIIISTNTRPTPSLHMFEKKFKTFLYDDVWIRDRQNNKLRNSIERICHENNATHFWVTKGGENDGIMPTNVKTLAACIFEMNEPHGDVYSGICEYISNKHGGSYPCIYPIIQKDFPDYYDDYREELGIPKESIVFGRHGGKEEFNIDFVKNAVIQALDKRSDIYFLFLNTNNFISHERVIYLDWTSDFKLKSKFVNTCDAMLHARYHGEIFSQAVAEFSIRNKPIITWKPSGITSLRVATPQSFHDTGHLWELQDTAYYYTDFNDILNILLNISKSDIINKDWDVYKDKYSPQNVMNDFEKIFLT